MYTSEFELLEAVLVLVAISPLSTIRKFQNKGDKVGNKEAETLELGGAPKVMHMTLLDGSCTKREPNSISLQHAERIITPVLNR